MKEKVRGQQLKKILYIIFTLALFITFAIKGEGGDGTPSFPPVCSPLIWLWNVMVIPLLQYVHIINYCTLGPQRRKKKSLYKIDRSTDTIFSHKDCVKLKAKEINAIKKYYKMR